MQKRLIRLILLVAGIVTVLVILLSPSIYSPETKKNVSQQESGKAPVPTVIQAPSDVVTSPSVHLDEPSATVVKSPASGETEVVPSFPVERILSPYLVTLFRAIISPNAP